jgi:hypothetical protein
VGLSLRLGSRRAPRPVRRCTALTPPPRRRRLCLTAAAREHVLVSSNLLQEGPITFAPVGGATSFARGAALQRAPTFASGSDRRAAPCVLCSAR